jgi:GAF domain-containing protein
LTRRTRYLEATAAIARDAASVLDLGEQLARVVNLVSRQFGFYHTGIFFLDPGGEWVVLQAASSEGGRRMLARDHRLRLGEGIVGYTVERGAPRIALDVGQDAVFFDNPDLPDTRSEMALPLRARGQIIGALDVQSTEPEAFGDEDVAVLQTLADQVAVAISNARLFEQAQEALAAERRAYGEMSSLAWRELLRAEPELGYLSQRQDTVPAGDLWRAEMKAAIEQGETALGDGDSRTVAIPIKISDQVVGVVDGRKADGSGGWSAEEIELLEALTEQLNVALEGSRLYQDVQRRAAREQLISQVSARMRETLDLDTVLHSALQEMRETLGFAEVAVLLDPAGDWSDEA